MFLKATDMIGMGYKVFDKDTGEEIHEVTSVGVEFTGEYYQYEKDENGKLIVEYTPEPAIKKVLRKGNIELRKVE